MSMLQRIYKHLPKDELVVHPKVLKTFSLLSQYPLTLSPTAAQKVKTDIFFSRPIFVQPKRNDKFFVVAGIARLQFAIFQHEQWVPAVILQGNLGRSVEELLVKSVLSDGLLSVERKQIYAALYDSLALLISSGAKLDDSGTSRSFEKSVQFLTDQQRQPVRGVRRTAINHPLIALNLHFVA